MGVIGPFLPTEGLTTESDYFTISSKKAITLSDVFLSASTLVNRCGVAFLNSSNFSTTHVISGLTLWVDPAQALSGGVNSPIVVAVANSKIWSAVLGTPNTMSFTDVTGTASVAVQSYSPFYTFASLGGKLIGTGGSGGSKVPFKITTYNGNAANLGGSPPKGDIVYSLNNFLFISRDLSSSANLSRVYWSAVGDPETWPASSFLDFRVNDGDTITALSSIGNQLIIFKQRSMGILQTTTQNIAGTTTLGPLNTISERIGCAGPKAVDHLPDGRIIFAGNDAKIYIFDGSSLVDISKQAYPNPSLYPDLNSLGISFLNYANVCVNTARGIVYIVFLNNSGQQAQSYIYSFIENTFTRQYFTRVGGNTYPSYFHYASTYLSLGIQQSYVLAGTSEGNIVDIDAFSNTGGPTETSSAASAVNPVIEMSFSLPMTPNPFIPRTLLIPAIVTTGTMVVAVGFNGTYQSAAPVAMGSRGALWNLFDLRGVNATLARPINMQVKITMTQTGGGAAPVFTLYPFYISDEVMN